MSPGGGDSWRGGEEVEREPLNAPCVRRRTGTWNRVSEDEMDARAGFVSRGQGEELYVWNNKGLGRNIESGGACFCTLQQLSSVFDIPKRTDNDVGRG